jgi:hypothetical protein
MTEAEWLASRDTDVLILNITTTSSERRTCLVACACFWSVWLCSQMIFAPSSGY